MKLVVQNMQGQPVGEVDWSDGGLPKNKGRQAVHDAVVADLNNRRAGTASTKTKGTVAGSGKKPWKQKGTGRARAGYQQSPLWRGGGVVFGPKPRDFSKDMNRKVGRLALWRALTDKAAAGELTVVEDFAVAEPKTRVFVAAVKALKVAQPLLLVVGEVTEALHRASRNVAGVQVVTPGTVHVYDIVRSQGLVVTRPALDALGRRVSASVGQEAT
jgi:large subunit ribosomal protein L4